MWVLGGTAGGAIAQGVAEGLKAPLGRVEVKTFPDGEIYVRLLDDVKDRDVVYVQSSWPNDKLVEMLLTLAALREHGARSITAVVPYLAYARQDRVFQSGEGTSAAAVLKLIAQFADRFVTVDPHKEHVLPFFGTRALDVSAIRLIADHLVEVGPDLVLAPDKGALDRAEALARELGTPVDHLEKTRLSGTEVRMAPKALDVAGKVVVIVDDMISTGGTIATAVKELKRQGAAKVVAACTHGLFVGGALDRLAQAGIDGVVATDTLANPVAKVAVAPAIVDALARR